MSDSSPISDQLENQVNEALNAKFYKDRVYEYAREQLKQNQIKKNKYVPDGKDVWVIYARQSAKDKERDRSIPDQIKDCQMIAERDEISPVRIFQENESAKISGRRPQYDEMIRGIEKGQWNSILAYHPNRLARNMKEGGEIIDLLDNHKIRNLKFHNYTFNNDPHGKMTLGIEFVMAKQYSDNLSEVSTRGSVGIVSSGKALIKSRPKRGYKVVNRLYQPDGRNFDLLKQAFKLLLLGQSQREVAEWLNKQKFEYSGEICKMTDQKVSEIANDPFYCGINVYGTSAIVDMLEVAPNFQPIISYMDFCRLQELMHKKLAPFRRAKSDVELLKQQVYCGHCGNLMTTGISTGHDKKNKYYYVRCNNRKCPSYLEGKPESIRSRVIFRFIDELLVEPIEVTPEAYDEYVKGATYEAILAKKDYQGKIKSLEMQIKNLDNDIDVESNKLSKAKNQALIDKINDDIGELMAHQDRIREEIKAYKQKIIDLDFVETEPPWSRGEFLNFLKNVRSIVKNSSNHALVDKLLRMIFLNFTIKDRKVVAYQLNPEFEKYLKPTSSLYCRSDRT